MSNRLLTDDTGLAMLEAIKQQTGVIARTGRKSALEPYSYDDVLSIVRLGLAPYMFSIGDIIEVARETALSATLGEHTGITGVTVNEETFIAAVDEAGEKEYEIVFDGSAWKCDGELIILADYGIAVTGSAVDGDTILIIETAALLHMVVMDFIENGQTAAGNIKLHDKTKQYGMILQSRDLLYGLQFDSREAFFTNDGDSAMSAGTYHVKIGEQPWYASDVNKYIQFTLTQDLPVGGQLVMTQGYNATAIGATIKVYASGSATTETETVTMSEGSDGTDLGTLTNAGSGSLNSIQRALLGSNRWGTSAMRQHLNSAAKAGSVWTPQTKFDRPPSWVSSTVGFKHGLDPEFIKICADVELLTALNTVSDATSADGAAGTGYETTVDKFFLPSRPEVFGGSDNNSDKGTPWTYYKANSDVPGGSSNSGNDSNRIKRYASGSASYWWLRSPYVGYASYVRLIYPAGGIYNGGAYGSYGVAPACVVA